MNIVSEFGLNVPLLIAQIINFLIVFYIMKRYLYRPTLNVLKKRKEAIKDGLKKAEEGKKALEDAKAEEKKMIKEAQTTANQIIKDAREEAVALVKKAEEDTKKQTAHMLAEARVQIEQQTAHAQTQLNKHVTMLSIELLKKSLANVFTEKEQSELVEKAMKELQKRPN